MRGYTALLGALLALTPSACRKPGFGAGFQGAVTIHTTRGSQPPSDMVVKIKGERMRFETQGADGSTDVAIYVPDQKRLVMVFDSTRTIMNMNLSGPSGAPNTSPIASAVQKVDTVDTIAGVPCENYRVRDPSGRRTEACIAKGIAYFDLASIRSPGGGTTWSKQMRDAKMFPLRSVEYDASGVEVSRSEVVSIDAESIDDAQFDVPAGYHAIGMPVR